MNFSDAMAKVRPASAKVEPYSREYQSFRASVPLRKVVVDENGRGSWEVYDCGPKDVRNALVMLPPLSGTGDVYFKQMLALSARNIRVLAVSWPAYWSVSDWCAGFRRLLDSLELERVHLFGAALGGFLAQKFAEMYSVGRPIPRVASLVLCNTFTDTSIFGYRDASPFFWLLPSMFLKRMILGNMPYGSPDPDIVQSIDFMVNMVEKMSQSQLASRLTLNCSPTYVMPQHLREIPITVIDVWDPYALAPPVRDELLRSFPHAKRAHLKTGGNFPYLSRSDEVDMHIMLHLKQFEGTKWQPSGITGEEPVEATEAH